jgi:hypothetical protein
MTIFGLDDVLTFGKYKGCVVKNVIAKNPSYISWANQNIEWFELSPEASNQLRITPVPVRYSGYSRYMVGAQDDDVNYDDPDFSYDGLPIGW